MGRTKTRFTKKKKVKKPIFNVAHKKTDEYINSHIVDHIEDHNLRPSDDDDRDVQVFEGFHGKGDVKEEVNSQGEVIIEHAPEVREFLASCPHLDVTHALMLLEDYPMEEAIRRGKNTIMAPRGHIPKWAEVDLEDPTDQRWKAADAKLKKAENEKWLLGEDYVPEPVRKIRDIEKEMVDAMDPKKVEEAYTKVVWPVERLVVKRKKTKSKKVKKAPKKEKEESKKLDTKKVVKHCKKGQKNDKNSSTTSKSSSAPPKAVSVTNKKSKDSKIAKAVNVKKSTVVAQKKMKKIVKVKASIMKAKKGGCTVLTTKKVVKYIEKKKDAASSSNIKTSIKPVVKLVAKPKSKAKRHEGRKTAAGPNSKNGTNSKPSSTLAAAKTTTKNKKSTRPIKPLVPRKGSPGKENATKIEKVKAAKQVMKVRKPVLTKTASK